MKLMISHAYTGGLLSWFLLTCALGDVPYLRTSTRDLKIKTNRAITLIQAEKGKIAVRISQTIVGNSADGCDVNDDASNARIMFATFMDPDTLQEKCGIFQRNASPCFQEKVVVGCDPKADTATINLYVVDESFGKDMITESPEIGRCKAGKEGTVIIKRAIKVTKTFDCLPLSNVERSLILFNTCSDMFDYCTPGKRCNYSRSEGYSCGKPFSSCSCKEGEECFYSDLKDRSACRPFAQLGDRCEVFEYYDTEISYTCDPKISFCHFQDNCFGIDPICVAFSSDAQCSSGGCDYDNEYCDFSLNRCIPLSKRGDCCDDVLECGDGLTCPYGICKTKCDGRNSKCPKNEYCADTQVVDVAQDDDFIDGYYDDVYDDPPFPYCEAIALKGEACGGVFWNGYGVECDTELYCYYPEKQDFHHYHNKGICWSPGKLCQDVTDCEFNEEWCDMTDGLCKPRLPKLFYCDTSVKKQCQKGLKCNSHDGFATCDEDYYK